MGEAEGAKSEQLSPVLSEFLTHLSNKRMLIQEQITQECFNLTSGKKKPTSFSVPELKTMAERQIREIDHMARLVLQAGNDPVIQGIAQELNEVYSEIEMAAIADPGVVFDAENLTCDKMGEAYKKQQELQKKLVFTVETSEGEKKRAVSAVFTDVLKERPKNHAIDKLFQGSPEAQMEMLQVTIEYYYDALDQVLALPKKERDEKLEQIERVLYFYKHLLNGETRKEWVATLGAKAKEMAKGSNKSNFRDLLYKGKNALQDGMNSALAAVLGGSEESLLVWLHEKAMHFERALSRPVKPDDPIVLEALQTELMTYLDGIADDIDEQVIDDLFGASAALRALPSRMLSPSEMDEYRKPYKDFLFKVVLPVQGNIIKAHSQIMTTAYQYSHGEDSMMDADSLWRAKTGQLKGRDISRTLQVFAPFGIGLPDKVQLKPFHSRLNDFEESLTTEEKAKMVLYLPDSKTIFRIVKGWDNFSQKEKEYYFRKFKHGGVEDVQIQSYWDTGFWEEHPMFSLGAQSSLGYLAVRSLPAVATASYQVARGAGWVGRGLANRFIPLAKRIPKFMPKALPPWVGPIVQRVGWAYLGYEIGDWINGEILDSMEESVQEDVKEYYERYGLSNKWPEDLKQDIRYRILRNALQKRRGYFQGIGYDLEDLGMDFWNRAFLGNAGDDSGSSFLGIRDTMVETGAFREALIETNWQLNMMGLNNFTIN